jgi:small-conductance mechanosensitive channel
MNREIIPVENINLHMIWSKGRIYIKPLPRYLLLLSDEERAFTQKYIDASPLLQPYALGLLYSYTALIASPLDLSIAHSKNLLPSTLSWPQWKDLIANLSLTLTPEQPYSKIAPRYIHGELRLSRLNKISRLIGQSLAYGFLPETSTSLFSEFYAENFGKLAAALVYVALLLTAMQVGLADIYLVENEAFQRACYGFAIFAMVAPLVIAVVIFLAAGGFLLGQWWKTSREFGRRMALVKKAKEGSVP